MSELLALGWNVAAPEVDIGSDVFVVRDKDGTFRQVQVKSAAARSLKSGYSAQVSIKLARLADPGVPQELVFVFPVRDKTKNTWVCFIVMQRDILYSYHTVDGIGTLAGKKKDQVHFTFSSKKGTLRLGKEDVTMCQNGWNPYFPPVQH